MLCVMSATQGFGFRSESGSGRQPVLICMHCCVQVGDSLEEFLLSATDDGKLRQLMMSLSEAIRTIAFKVCWQALT